jgi:hypothetical protein
MEQPGDRQMVKRGLMGLISSKYVNSFLVIFSGLGAVLSRFLIKSFTSFVKELSTLSKYSFLKTL